MALSQKDNSLFRKLYSCGLSGRNGSFRSKLLNNETRKKVEAFLERLFSMHKNRKVPIKYRFSALSNK